MNKKEERVQGFLCPWCGKSFHVEKRGFSRSSLKNEVKRAIGIFRARGKTPLRYTQERRKWTSPCLSFIERNSRGLFLYKRLLNEKIEHTKGAAQDHI